MVGFILAGVVVVACVRCCASPIVVDVQWFVDIVFAQWTIKSPQKGAKTSDVLVPYSNSTTISISNPNTKTLTSSCLWLTTDRHTQDGNDVDRAETGSSRPVYNLLNRLHRWPPQHRLQTCLRPSGSIPVCRSSALLLSWSFLERSSLGKLLSAVVNYMAIWDER